MGLETFLQTDRLVHTVKRLLLFVLAVVPCVCCALAEEPWRAAIGDVSGLPASQRIWFLEPSHFKPHSEPYGESVDDYRALYHTVPTASRQTIVLRWLGDEAPKELSALADYVRAFFALPVRLEYRADYRWPPSQGGKFSAEQLQGELKTTLPDDAFVVVGLTDRDIFSEDSGPDHLLFGQGHYYNRTAVASVFRLRTGDSQLYFHRICKLVSHEIVHTFSMEHCGFFDCLMNPSASVESSDRRPLFLCPVCLLKMHGVLGFEPRLRYRDLLERSGLLEVDDRDWLKKRLDLSGLSHDRQ